MWSISQKEWKDSTRYGRLFDEFAWFLRNIIEGVHYFALSSRL